MSKEGGFTYNITSVSSDMKATEGLGCAGYSGERGNKSGAFHFTSEIWTVDSADGQVYTKSLASFGWSTVIKKAGAQETTPFTNGAWVDIAVMIVLNGIAMHFIEKDGRPVEIRDASGSRKRRSACHLARPCAGRPR